MICNKCGSENNSTNRNCSFCGNQLIFEQINPNYQTIQSVNNSNKKSNKWIFIAIGALIGIPVFIVGAIVIIAVVVALIESANDPFQGKWFCSTYDDLNNYSVALDFDNSDSRFNIYKYGDEANNYITGEYEYKKVEEDDEIYYELTFDVDKYIADGKLQNNSLDKYIIEFSKDDESSQMIMSDTRGYNKYYCVKR